MWELLREVWGTSDSSAIGILAIKGEVNAALAFAQRGTYNPANREKGLSLDRSNRVTPRLPVPCQEFPAFQRRIGTRCGPGGMQ